MSETRDRDASTDKLLRGALSGQPTELSDDCLDAETAAAWFDGGLTDDRREHIEAHLADCARCQAVLGAVARTAVAAADSPAVTRSRWWLGWFVPVAAAAAIVVAVLVIPDRGPIDRIDPAASSPSTAAEPAGARRERLAETAEADEAPPAREGRLDVARGNEAVAPPVAAEPPASPPASPAVGRSLDQVQQRQTQVAQPAETEALLADATGFDIASPDPAARWRVRGTIVERTADGGATWTDATEFGAAPVAGSAPSASTCWVVGAAGAVWLTVDGLTWQRLEFPETVNLTAIEAVDDRTATVTTADGRVFSTTNGGATWVRRAPVQET